MRAAVGAATTVGGVDSSTHLAPATVGRQACDASIIPVVLGPQGEVMDLGRTIRFFTPAQTRRL